MIAEIDRDKYLKVRKFIRENRDKGDISARLERQFGPKLVKLFYKIAESVMKGEFALDQLHLAILFADGRVKIELMDEETMEVENADGNTSGSDSSEPSGGIRTEDESGGSEI